MQRIKQGIGKGFAAAVAILLWSVTAGCSQGDKEPIRADRLQLNETTAVLGAVSTDKAAYKPGETVRFEMSLKRADASGELVVQYRHLGEMVDRSVIKLKAGLDHAEWTWNPPEEDYQGYMTEIYWREDGVVREHANIGVDVSSDWGKFPRYGYLADFGKMTADQQKEIVARLNRFHLNGVQFYDWQWKHHVPLKLDQDGKPAAEWPDIAGRATSFNTVKGYIDLLHERGIKAMNYNLLFGAYDDYEQDGVKPEWGLYKDRLHANQDRHVLPDSWESDIQLMDPGNGDWLDYLFGEEKKTFERLPFDGWHVDQLGNRGNLFTFDGKPVTLMLSYGEMLKKAKQAIDVDYVMNAVDQYGQALIAKSPVKFLYSELWDSYPGYKDLKRVLDGNRELTEGRLNTVLAAYMNYGIADRAGEFNTPGVLLTDAVIFASGGSHIEAGENLLAKEYFPNRNLRIPPKLEESLISYYDFMTAYQNVLRGGVEEAAGTKVAMATGSAGDSSLAVSAEAEGGKVWSFVKKKDNRLIAHFINFSEATTMQWNDTLGSQAEPKARNNVSVVIPSTQEISRAWMATPDAYGGSPIELPFESVYGGVSVSLPTLKYWSMVVLESKG
ncbi:glycoside hydrolase family 66 protein [Cohnella luojiensis]|uniref:Cycloisomaltooligosaccharide glucanotransferase n=1 Tax=Cohnella luojiensis TaxID=652876 RepID=A0A4Y8M7H4_9BACL|nr:glycoside hydrolase family 66 protein [Cohnella luojiensis]TFE31534.1 hypothetical protein E2980_00145 [Cohnella luojiensis]